MILLAKIYKNTKYISSVSFLYGITLLLLWSALSPIISQNFTSRYAVSLAASAASFNPPPKVKNISINSGIPKRLIIPALSIDKEILDGAYNVEAKTWDLSDAGIHYAHPSNIANDHGGNTLIYGHNNMLTFGPLYSLKEGDKVYLITDNNLKFTYKFNFYKNFDPKDVSVFAYSGPPKLTLQTCGGYWNETRVLYDFSLSKVEET